MATSTNPFVIVCAVDLGEMSTVVVEHALAEARHHSSVRLHCLTVIPGKGRLRPTRPADSEFEEARTALEKIVSEEITNLGFSDDGCNRQLRYHVRWGDAGDEIIELAYESRAKMIVIGRYTEHARHGGRAGSTATRVLLDAPCSVFAVTVIDNGLPSEDYNQCEACVQVRATSGGERWFCDEHMGEREPRLSSHVGLSSNTPGWGLF
jgi:nucleotide-binding universal stress UspA family protein